MNRFYSQITSRILQQSDFLNICDNDCAKCQNFVHRNNFRRKMVLNEIFSILKIFSVKSKAQRNYRNTCIQLKSLNPYQADKCINSKLLEYPNEPVIYLKGTFCSFETGLKQIIIIKNLHKSNGSIIKKSSTQ